MMMTTEVSEQIEDLLVVWYHWMKAQREYLGAPRVSPGFRHADSTDVYEDGDDRDDKISRYQAEQVNVCLDELCFEHRHILGAYASIRANNRLCNAQVFGSPRLQYLSPAARHAAYQEAKVALLQRFVKRDLIRTVDTVHKQDSNTHKAGELRPNYS